MIKPGDIESLFNHYKNSISTIQKLENSFLREAYSFKRWSVLQKEKSRNIRECCEVNRKLLADVLDRFTDPSLYPLLTEETADAISSHIDFFMSEGFRDYKLVIPPLEVLIRFYSENGNRERLFDAYYYKALGLMELRRYGEAVECFEKALAIYPDIGGCKMEYRIYRIMCTYYYRLLAAAIDEEQDSERIAEFVLSAMDIWTHSPIENLLSVKKEAAIRSILSTLAAIVIERYIDRGMEPDERMAAVLMEEYRRQLLHTVSEKDIDSRIYVVYYKYLRYKDRISGEEYIAKIDEKYTAEYMNNSSNFDYGCTDFIHLFDDELLDEDFAAEMLFFMNTSFTYVYYVLPAMLKNHQADRNSPLAREIFEEIQRYFAGMPITGGDFLVDEFIEIYIKNILGYCESYEIAVGILESVMVVRQVVTVIHSYMVSSLCGVITEHIIENAPELFVGQWGIVSPAEVEERREELVNFARNAGKLHDVGKITCSDIINLQSRGIEVAEFRRIKEHPQIGHDILSASHKLCPYAQIALLHHKSWDGERGYPQEQAKTGCEHEVFVDIVKICDCIDAATDRLGRNYAKGKSFYEVLEELKRDKGKEYSPQIVELLEKDQDLCRELDKMTSGQRMHTYYKVYHDLIENEIEFRPMDERFVRKCRESDIEKIAHLAGVPVDEARRRFLDNARLSFAVLDGYGNLYGYIFARPSEKPEDNIDIREIVVEKRFRMCGYGSMLVKALEDIAKKEDYKTMTFRCGVKGHYDKFGWRNGFSEIERNDVIVMRKMIK